MRRTTTGDPVMALKTTLDSIESLPQPIQELYSPSGGKFKLTGIEGIKTQDDIDALTTSLGKERADHKATKARLSTWKGMDFADVQARLDNVQVLEAQLENALTGSSGDVDATVSRLTELKMQGATRQITALKTELGELKSANALMLEAEQKQAVTGAMRDAAIAAGVRNSAIEDAVMYGEAMLCVNDGGEVVTREGLDVHANQTAAALLVEFRESKPHWWGGDPATGGGGGVNYWTEKDWNMTKQMHLRASNPES